MQHVSAECLRTLLDYNPETGIFTRKIATANRHKIGEVVGSFGGAGYLSTTIFGRTYSMHRLAWLYVHGEMPSGNLDHANRVKTDNRIANLRIVTQRQNVANTPIPKHNTSGVKGVCWHKAAGKWMAQIKVDGKFRYLGLYSTLEDAKNAYEAVARAVHGEFACFEPTQLQARG